MAAKRLADAERRLDVDRVAGAEAAERAALQGLGDGVEGELLAVDGDDRQADARDRDGVAERGLGRRAGRLEPQACPLPVALDFEVWMRASRDFSPGC